MVEDEVHITYGIECLKDDILISRIDDISINKEEVEKTIDLFNKSQLDITHFQDAVEDSII